jgi:hypothetical protein
MPHDEEVELDEYQLSIEEVGNNELEEDQEAEM